MTRAREKSVSGEHDQPDSKILDQALVSVIIPAFNAADSIGQTLNSVLAQTYPKIEVIVVDDGSSDATGTVVKEFMVRDDRIQLVQQSNAGAGAARNSAIRRARGKYIAPLDADDFWFPAKLEKQVARLEQFGNEAGMVYCWSMLIDRHGELFGDCSQIVEGRLRRAMILRNIVGNGSVPLFRTTTLEKVGLYLTRAEQEGAQGCEDWDLYLRISEQFDLQVVPEYLVAYRQGSSKMSANAENMATSFGVVMRRARKRNSDLPSSLFRWSSGFFYLYLVQNSYLWGHHQRCQRLLQEAVRADPALLLRTTVYRIWVRTLLETIIGSRIKNSRRWLPASPADQKREIPNEDAERKKKRSFISNRIFDEIERRRWSAALENGA
jgi:glycosyltransferase involved in cell wall biosynthesis